MLSKKITSNIALTIKEARKKRHLSQHEVAQKLDITQARYSQIENGKGSFSAEQLIALVRFFNIPLSVFEGPLKKTDEGQELQNAVAYFGGQNLYEASDLLPSEKFDKLNGVIVETIISGRPSRLLINLAVAIVKNIYDVKFDWIESSLLQRGYLNRWGWLLENTFEAIGQLPNLSKRKYGRALFKISHNLDILKLEWETDKDKIRETILDGNIASDKTLKEVVAARSDISKRWKIISRLQVDDFKKSLDEVML